MENKKKQSILIIDNDPQVRDVIQRMILRLGYTVAGVDSGEEALAVFKDQSIELVITDIRLPGMSGMEVLKQIKAIDPLTQTIVLTGYGNIDLAITALKDYDAFDFLSKPKGISELLVAVEKALKHGRLARKNKRLQKEVHQQNLNLKRHNRQLRQTQAAVKRSHQRYQDLYHHAPVGYLTVDTGGRIVDTNQTAADLFGTHRRALRNRPFDTLVNPSDLELYATCRNSIQHGHTHVCEMMLKKTDGTLFSARLEAKVVIDPNCMQKQTWVIVTDISAQKELQGQILERRKLDAIATLAGGVAHQFNNALAGLTGYLDLIQIEFSQKETDSKHLPLVFQQVNRMTDLTRQLLTYASSDKSMPCNISISQFFNEIHALIRHSISNKNHLETELPAEIHLIRADSTQLQIVLLALVQNASEAMQTPGRILISARNTTISPVDVDSSTKRRPGKYVCICVHDEGCGMDTTTLEKIFDPFYTTKFIGRGLGLSVAHGIVSNHKGWIEVESSPGRGTQISIYLPAVTANTAETVMQRKAASDGHDDTVLVV